MRCGLQSTLRATNSFASADEFVAERGLRKRSAELLLASSWILLDPPRFSRIPFATTRPFESATAFASANSFAPTNAFAWATMCPHPSQFSYADPIVQETYPNGGEAYPLEPTLWRLPFGAYPLKPTLCNLPFGAYPLEPTLWSLPFAAYPWQPTHESNMSQT